MNIPLSRGRVTLCPYAHMRTPPRGVGGYWGFALAKFSTKLWRVCRLLRWSADGQSAAPLPSNAPANLPYRLMWRPSITGWAKTSTSNPNGKRRKNNQWAQAEVCAYYYGLTILECWPVKPIQQRVRAA